MTLKQAQKQYDDAVKTIRRNRQKRRLRHLIIVVRTFNIWEKVNLFSRSLETENAWQAAEGACHMARRFRAVDAKTEDFIHRKTETENKITDLGEAGNVKYRSSQRE